MTEHFLSSNFISSGTSEDEQGHQVVALTLSLLVCVTSRLSCFPQTITVLYFLQIWTWTCGKTEKDAVFSRTRPVAGKCSPSSLASNRNPYLSPASNTNMRNGNCKLKEEIIAGCQAVFPLFPSCTGGSLLLLVSPNKETVPTRHVCC